MEAGSSGFSEADWIHECLKSCDFNFDDNDFMYSLFSETTSHYVSSSSPDAAGSCNYSSPVTALEMAHTCCPDFEHGLCPNHQHHGIHVPFCCQNDYPADQKVLGVDLNIFRPELPSCCTSSSSYSSPCSCSSSSSSSTSSSSSESMTLIIKQENEDHHDYFICNPVKVSHQMIADFTMMPVPAAPVTVASKTPTPRKVRRKRKNKEPAEAIPEEEKIFPCPYSDCGNVYLKSSHLKVHIRRHTGEKPFKCTWQNCDWSFRRSDELSRHKRCHSGVKPYECSLCGKSFARSDHLSKHMKVHRRSGSISSSLKEYEDSVKSSSAATAAVGMGRRRRHYLAVKPMSIDAPIIQHSGRAISVQN